MAYLTVQEMVLRFGEVEMTQLTDRESYTGTVDCTVCNAAIADAENEANAFIGMRYSLPLVAVPLLLKSYIADIARYRLYRVEIPDIVIKRYDDAIKFLKLLGEGKVDLGLGANNIEVQAAEATQVANVRSVTRQPVFSAQTLDYY